MCNEQHSERKYLYTQEDRHDGLDWSEELLQKIVS